MKEKRLIIEASNIHLGGGLVLLHQLLTKLEEENQETLVFLDSRLKEKYSNSSVIEINFIKPTITSRLKHYFKLSKLPKANDTLFCFGNIPPFRRNLGYRSVVFLQNWFLICNWKKIKADNIQVYIRLVIERALLKIFHKNVNLFIAQTDSMKRQLLKKLNNIDVLVQPFLSISSISKQDSADFYFYPARGDESKNHRNLVKAWIKLSKRGIYPELVITIDSSVNPDLCTWVDKMNTKYALNIQNLGFLDYSKIADIYSKSPVIIFPSYFESFGMPLVEGNKHGCDIIASELDYVRDVCRPIETFDPHSSNSIASAVQRHLKLDSEIKCGSVAEIINTLLTR